VLDLKIYYYFYHLICRLKVCHTDALELFSHGLLPSKETVIASQRSCKDQTCKNEGGAFKIFGPEEFQWLQWFDHSDQQQPNFRDR
jgi:hypothetical protein